MQSSNNISWKETRKKENQLNNQVNAEKPIINLIKNWNDI